MLITTTIVQMCFHVCGRMSEYCFLLFALKFSAKSSHYSAKPTHRNTHRHIHRCCEHTHSSSWSKDACTHSHSCTRAQKVAIIMQQKAHTHAHNTTCVCACVSLINRVINNMRGRDSVSVVVWCFVAGGSCRHTNIPNSNYHPCGHWRLMSPLLANRGLRSWWGTPPLACRCSSRHPELFVGQQW